MARIWRGEARLARSFLFIPLFLVSSLYAQALKLRESWWLNRAEMVDKAPIPVISVGNITVGGSGKTPVVERLACLLQARGYRPSIVLRGYGRKKKGVFTVDPLRDNHETVGDEALMLARRTGLPVVVATRRIDGVREALSRCATDLTLLDDGFQVRDIKKDMEILVINARAAANKDLFPLGPLREPVSALGRADVVLVNKGEPDDSVKDVTAGTPLFRVRYRPLHLFCMSRNSIVHHGFLKKKKVTAFCGLGDNGPFFDLLRALGADAVQEVEFDDHHRYTPRDMERLLSCAGADLLVTTEKDAVKLEGLDIPENLFYLAIEAEIEREDELIDQIVKTVKGEPCKTDC